MVVHQGGGRVAQRGDEVHVLLRDLLAGYDRQVEGALAEALRAGTGVGRVRALHNAVRPSIAVHDAVLESALCPMLVDLPGGHEVADRLGRGCRERAELLGRFETLSRNVAAQNVYPVSGQEVEEILDELGRSFRAHVDDETTKVADLLEAAAQSVDPDVVAARMALEAQRAPTASHRATVKHPESVLLKRLYRSRDLYADWVDSHHGWRDPREVQRSPRSLEVDALQRQAVASPPSVRGVLGGYDATIEAMIADLGGAGPLARAQMVNRLSAAITIHDSVLGGVLCPLLDGVAGGEPLADRLRQGCRDRAELQQQWNALTKRVPLQDVYEEHQAEAEGIVQPLIASFRSHEREEDLEVGPFLEHLPDDSFRTKLSPFEDVMWPWKSEGPAALALHMALWAESAPTRVHPLLVRHPSSRALRTLYHLVDHVRDFWS